MKAKPSLSDLLPVKQKNSQKPLAALGVALLALTLLYFSLRGLDWRVFWLTLGHLQYGFIPLFFLTASLSYLFRALRWRILVQFEKPVSIADVFWANMSGYFGNNLLPARAGELIRAVYLGKLADIDPSFVLATGLVERLMDVLALVIIGSISLALTGIVSSALQSALLVMSVVGLAGVIFLMALVRYSAFARRLMDKVPLLNSEHKATLIRLFDQFVRGIQSLLSLRSILGFILLTALIWLLDGLQTAGLALLFGFPLSLAQALVLLAGLGLSSAIPSTPGYLGIYQFVAVMILVPFGLGRETAIAFMLVLQVTGLLAVFFWGGISLWRARRLAQPGEIE